MKVEVGKIYRSRSCAKIGPMEGYYNDKESPYRYTFEGALWDSEGNRAWTEGYDDPTDLVELWDEPDSISIVEGKYYKSVNGEKIGPMHLFDPQDVCFSSRGLLQGGLWNKDGSPYFEDATDSPIIVSEWVEEKDLKLWKDMTPEEKGALLLAHHEGKVIENQSPSLGQLNWIAATPIWAYNFAYRVKPDPVEPVVEVVEIHGGSHLGYWSLGTRPLAGDKYKITLTLIDGEPNSIATVEKIDAN